MEYSIGEVSALLHISRDMIRYYEKQGAIRSSRNAENNYRCYDSMEVFWLLEAMQHKSWGIPISKIADIRNHEYTFNTSQFLQNEADRQRQEASYKKLLSRRLEELKGYMLTGMRNVGNYWVENSEAEYRCPLVRSKGDEYERINLPEEASIYSFSEKNLPFIDNGLTVSGEYTDWELSIGKHYADSLNNPVPDAFVQLPGGLRLCTNIDIGEIGAFDSQRFEVLWQYAELHGYRLQPNCRIRGTLLGRGFERGTFHRIVKISLPIF